ncbi:hypothetical protein B0H16DRAFT_199425 [Mycena metata]|uniref:Uncharacterized protein n=1 Tax=Mycena metata TaxID=1033252 RepID=A0AAD7HZP9_9AGAR|nr:hypothetical protein B0H16DRAFT_199425 [Mycena metata]
MNSGISMWLAWAALAFNLRSMLRVFFIHIHLADITLTRIAAQVPALSLFPRRRDHYFFSTPPSIHRTSLRISAGYP